MYRTQLTVLPTQHLVTSRRLLVNQLTVVVLSDANTYGNTYPVYAIFCEAVPGSS